MYKPVRPAYYSDDDASEQDEDHLGAVLNKNSAKTRHHDEQDNDDEYTSLSFGALNKAQQQLSKPKSSRKASNRRDDSDSSSDDSDDSDEEPLLQSSTSSKPRSKSTKYSKDKKRSKHAPAESSTKKPVSRIREIPGLTTKKDSTLHTDIRFDPAYGKADLHKTRSNYAFLDDYRKQEIKQMEGILRDKSRHRYLSESEQQIMTHKLQSLKSRLDTMKNRDLEHRILEDHRREQMDKVQKGEQVNPYFLKKSEQRKLIQKAKFETMKNSQREKVMERKRKKRLGKEFKQLEFRNRE